MAYRADDREYDVSADDRREVVLVDDDLEILPDQTRDDTDVGWGEYAGSTDRHLLDERPPHWG